MGIKNIHLVLITASSVLALFFGVWALNHSFGLLGVISLTLAVALIVYGIQFMRKLKALK